MYPMDFEEFAWAMNEEPLMAYIRQCFDKKVPLEQGIHAKAMPVSYTHLNQQSCRHPKNKQQFSCHAKQGGKKV